MVLPRKRDGYITVRYVTVLELKVALQLRSNRYG